jgi:CRP/FNR family transcriptional regulator, cyclic AMP receptor protein
VFETGEAMALAARARGASKQSRGPYGFEIGESCETCKLNRNGFYCDLPTAAFKDFSAIQSIAVYPQGALLFMEKEPSHGIYMLCQGRVKLSFSTCETKTLTLRIAKPGEVLGLTAVLTRSHYDATAETCRPCQIAYVGRENFLQFVVRHPEAYPGIVKQLAARYDKACDQLRTIASPKSAHKRLGKLLLEWAEETKLGDTVSMHLAHGEIGELIGMSREAVTRAFGRLRDQQLVVGRGARLMIPDRSALENFLAE